MGRSLFGTTSDSSPQSLSARCFAESPLPELCAVPSERETLMPGVESESQALGDVESVANWVAPRTRWALVRGSGGGAGGVCFLLRPGMGKVNLAMVAVPPALRFGDYLEGTTWNEVRGGM